MELLEKINEAINYCETSLNSKTSVVLNYSDLKEIRKLVTLENYREQLSVDNLREGMAFGKRLKSK